MIKAMVLTTLLSACSFSPNKVTDKEKQSIMFSVLMSTQTNFSSVVPLLNCNNNPYQKTNNQITSRYDLYPVNCPAPNNLTSIPNSSFTVAGVGAVSVSQSGSTVSATRQVGSGYLKFSFSPALATANHNKVLVFRLTGNDSGEAQKYPRTHSRLTIELFGDPMLASIYARDIYQPSQRFVETTSDAQYLNPRLVIPVLYGPDVQEMRITFSGDGQTLVLDNLSLADY
jgi:hypothetical protein